jgi:hypothetical protein
VTLDVDRADPVEGKANLVSAKAGSRIDVAARRELLGAASEGVRIQCRAKRTRDGVRCETHPDASHFTIG